MTRAELKRAVSLVTVMTVSASFLVACANEEEFRVKEIPTSNSVVLEAGDRVEAVTLHGIRSPILGLDCLADEAHNKLKDLLPIGSTVDVEFGVEGSNSHHAVLKSGGENIALSLLRDGLAVNESSSSTNSSEEYLAAESSAKDAKLGVFGVDDECLMPTDEAKKALRTAVEIKEETDHRDLYDPQSSAYLQGKMNEWAEANATMLKSQVDASAFHQIAWDARTSELIREFVELQTKRSSIIDQAFVDFQQKQRELDEASKRRISNEARDDATLVSNLLTILLALAGLVPHARGALLVGPKLIQVSKFLKGLPGVGLIARR